MTSWIGTLLSFISLCFAVVLVVAGLVLVLAVIFTWKDFP